MLTSVARAEGQGFEGSVCVCVCARMDFSLLLRDVLLVTVLRREGIAFRARRIRGLFGGIAVAS